MQYCSNTGGYYILLGNKYAYSWTNKTRHIFQQCSDCELYTTCLVISVDHRLNSQFPRCCFVVV